VENLNIAFIGGGHMAGSLVTGLIQSGYPSHKIWIADFDKDKLQGFKRELKIEITESDVVAAEKADVLVLAVKPQDIKKATESIKATLEKRHPLLISIAAGIRTNQLHRWLNPRLSIVRAMPNTPALLRAGATALYADGKVSEDQKSQAESIMRSVGVTVWVAHEHDMDTVTALSGSGPAYFFLFIEALQKAAEKLALPAETAKILCLQTALGAARMALESDLPVDALIKRIASPGGTTEKALEVLDNSDFQKIIEDTLKAAKDRADEISRHFEQI
jgi:pyrroline-5-carboxylate reductase